MEGQDFIDRKTQLPENFYSTKTFTAGKHDKGPDHLAEARLRRLQELGIIGCDIIPALPAGASGYRWEEMTDEQRARSARAMEVFAAMVELIDENVGRVMEYLESTGELDNTFILFMSDNGAEGTALEAIPIMGGTKTMSAIFDKYYDNSLENIGAADSFVWYGPRWACAATAPSRGMKSWVTEGGIRCPCIIRYPSFTTAPHAITHSFTTVMDILPTILSLAQLEHLGAHFRGREVVQPRGKSWVPHLYSSDYTQSSVHGEQVHVHGWEFLDHRAIREGDWKAVWMSKPRGNDSWELYHMKEDPAEIQNRAEEEPDILQRLVFYWEQYFAETRMIPCPMLRGRK